MTRMTMMMLTPTNRRQTVAFLTVAMLVSTDRLVMAAILKPSIQDCLKNLPPLRSLSLDIHQLVNMIPVAEESCQCVGRAGGAITEIFAAIFTEKLGIQLPECLMKAVHENDSSVSADDVAVGGSTYSFLENIVTSVVSEITNDLLFGRDETRGAHDMGSL